MASPLLFGAVLAGGYYLYRTFNKKTAIGDKGAKVTVDGITFQAEIVNAFPGGSTIVDVFTTNGSRVLRYEQIGTGATRTRKEIDFPPSIDPRIHAAGLKAFGVTPKAR